MFWLALQQLKISPVANFTHKMKRITKDRSARNLTTSESKSEIVTTKRRGKTTENKANKLPSTATEHNEPTTALKSENLADSLSKFKATNKPKLSQIKRPHVKVEYEEIKVDGVTIKREQEDEIDLVIKQEANEFKVEAGKVKQESDTLPSPKKKFKFESKSQAHIMEMLDHLREMRKEKNAPVDSMGCDMCMDKLSSPKDARYQALLSLMLSSMTKDQVTYAAMQKLIEYGCTMDKMLEVSDERLAEMIYPVNYWKKKVQYIKESTKMIKEDFDGDIPKTVKDLCKLKGVGPKMAHLCMKTAWGEITGIGVDTHVHRISNRMGWVQSKTPEDTRKQLEVLLPQDLWKEVNHLLVGFGQQICQQAKPQCATCLNNHFCPFGISYLAPKK